MTEPVWDPSVTTSVGNLSTGFSVCCSPCDTGWHYLGSLNAIPILFCDSLVAEVVGAPISGYPSPRLFGCSPEYDAMEVHGGKVYVSGVNHPPCEVSAGPDLRIGGWASNVVPDTTFAGEQIPFSWFRVRNGGCEAVSSFTNGYYLSTDAVITSADVLLASTAAVGGLGVYGDTLFSAAVLTIPPATVPGEYYIGILADNADAVAEDDETDNSVSTGITVIVPPRVWHIRPDGGGDAATIQAGVDSAAAGDTVMVACGTYHEHDIVMKSGIALISETGEPDCVTIEADALGRVIYCESVDSTTTIEGVTLAEGVAMNDHAGGIYMTCSSPTIRRCNIQENSAVGTGYDGGGVRCHYSSPHFIKCMFARNTAEDDAGGVYCRNYSFARFDYCIFADNSSSDKGGGLLCYDNSNAKIYNCTFYGNSAGLGSGIAAMQTSDLLPENTIISFGTGGGSVYCEPYAGCGISLSCSDVYGNAGGDWIDCIAGQDVLNANFTADPMFCEPDILDFNLESGSPCIDALGCGRVGALGEGCGLSAVGGDSKGQATFRLHASRPNPSNQSTRIAFSLARSGQIDLAIYDARGRRVTVLADGYSEAGEFEFTWDGTDGRGGQVPAGIYFCRFKAGEKSASQKIVLVR
ncbi:MAG: right-handed parallel beta-helix repeat-containing protein [Candidatus Eisenbacteria bacterium]